MSSAEENGVVRYTVKELLARMDGKLDQLNDKMDAKVERVEHEQLESRVNSLERWKWIVTGFVVAAQVAFAAYLNLG